MEEKPKTLCICVFDTFVEPEEGGGGVPVPAPRPLPVISPYFEEPVPTPSLARGPTLRVKLASFDMVAAH